MEEAAAAAIIVEMSKVKAMHKTYTVI